jgi:hypothetical protein
MAFCGLVEPAGGVDGAAGGELGVDEEKVRVCRSSLMELRLRRWAMELCLENQFLKVRNAIGTEVVALGSRGRGCN